MAYILVFEGDLSDIKNPEEHVCQMLLSRLLEALPIPVLKEWAKTLRKAGANQDLIAELTAGAERGAPVSLSEGCGLNIPWFLPSRQSAPGDSS